MGRDGAVAYRGGLTDDDKYLSPSLFLSMCIYVYAPKCMYAYILKKYMDSRWTYIYRRGHAAVGM